MNIRLLIPTEYPQIFALWRQTPGMGLNNLDDSQEGINRYLQRNPNTCFAAEEDNRLVGVILSGHDGRRAFIYHLAVAADYQRHGIGSALLEQAGERVLASGLRYVTLAVQTKNHPAISFAQANGLVFCGYNDHYYPNQDIAIFFARNLR